MTTTNPVVAIDLVTQDGVILRFRLPNIEQAKVMSEIGTLLAHLNVKIDVELPKEVDRPHA